MVPSRKPTVEIPAESVRESVSSAPVSARAPAFEVYELVRTRFPFTVEAETGLSVLWTPMIRLSSPLESALILILFVLISALVGVRLVEFASEYDVGRSALSGPSKSADSDGTQPDRDRSYESVVSADTPLEFLSDEGRVVRIVVENGGQIRQHQIVEKTGWSKSKVSRILSKMHDAGNIEKVSLGRENVITLTEQGVTEDEHLDDADHPLP